MISSLNYQIIQNDNNNNLVKVAEKRKLILTGQTK